MEKILECSKHGMQKHTNGLCHVCLSPSSAGSAVPVVVDPAYSEFFVKARIAAKENGYALAMHGSGIRDLDLIAIPWTDESRSPTNLIAQVAYRTDCETNGHPVTEHKHGRLSVVFMINDHFSDPRYVDFSIMPPKEQNV